MNVIQHLTLVKTYKKKALTKICVNTTIFVLFPFHTFVLFHSTVMRQIHDDETEFPGHVPTLQVEFEETPRSKI